MTKDFHMNHLIPPDPTKTISVDFWPSAHPNGRCESTILPLFLGWENRGKIVLSHLPFGWAEGQKSTERIVFVGSGGMRWFIWKSFVMVWGQGKHGFRVKTHFKIEPHVLESAVCRRYFQKCIRDRLDRPDITKSLNLVWNVARPPKTVQPVIHSILSTYDFFSGNVKWIQVTSYPERDQRWQAKEPEKIANNENSPNSTN